MVAFGHVTRGTASHLESRSFRDCFHHHKCMNARLGNFCYLCLCTFPDIAFVFNSRFVNDVLIRLTWVSVWASGNELGLP